MRIHKNGDARKTYRETYPETYPATFARRSKTVRETFKLLEPYVLSYKRRSILNRTTYDTGYVSGYVSGYGAFCRTTRGTARHTSRERLGIRFKKTAKTERLHIRLLNDSERFSNGAGYGFCG